MVMKKRGAIEFSMTTVIVIILSVTMLVLGIVLIQKIFKSGTNAIDDIDAEIKSEISRLFSSDNSKKIIVFPSSRRIDIQKGDGGYGFAFSIRNIDDTEGTFHYLITAVGTDCSSLSVEEADSLLALGKEGDIELPAGDVMENPKLVTFNIPETAPPCAVEYKIDVDKGGETYTPSVDVILNILGK
tara:strand:+ start:71 stop:628 length:558 start_codon:yes stop_codon:yes gene_type:complete